jgi:hypothetical protein
MPESPTIHGAEIGTLDPDDSGWYFANCICGYKKGPFPDAELVLDELMAHAQFVSDNRT